MEIKKILGQANPLASTGAYIYTVPENYGAVISTISVCNTGATSALFRIHIVNAADGGALIKNANFYDVALPANETMTMTLGITLSNSDQVYVYSNSANIAYSVYGVEFNQINVFAS